MIVPDVFRLLLLAQAGFTLGLILWIFVAYFRVWRRVVDHRRGLLPAHVFLVSFAHAMLILFAVIDVHERLGVDEMTWHTPYLVTAMVISDLALLIIMKLQVLRLRFLRETASEEMG